jgi:hypothetical protein
MALTKEISAVLRTSIAREATGPSMAEVVAGTTPAQLRGLAQASRFHGLGGYVHTSLDDVAGVPAEERAQLATMRTFAALNHLRTLAGLRYVGETFKEGGIPWLVIKGPTLAAPVHGAPELRWHADLDVLVPPHRLGDAITLLERRGSAMLDRNWDLIHEHLKGEVHLALPLGLELDLHWHLLNDSSLRSVFAIPLDGLFARARSIDVGGTRVPTLDAADTVVYVAMHMMLAGGHRLIWLKDLERLLASDIDVPAVARVARAWRAELVLAAALGRTNRVLGPAPGMQQLLEIAPHRRAWLALDGLASHVQPVERQDGWGSLIRILGRSVRTSQRSSVRELGRKVRRHVGEHPTDQEFDPQDPTDPRSDRHDAGGLRSRQAFLDEVAKEYGFEDVVEPVR